MLAGDESAFEAFFEAAYPVLYRFALARLGFDRDAAGDVAQAAICKAIGKLRTFRGEAALLTWLCTFCRHELYAFHRRNPGRFEVELTEDDPEIRAALESLGSEATVQRREVARIVHLVLDCLPNRYGDALEWKYIDGLTVVEIAERLTLAPKAAESLLTRARAAFRDAFRAAYGNEWNGVEVEA